MLSKKEVKHVASLARLRLSDKERKKMQKDLSSILDYIETLEEVDVSGVEIESVPKKLKKISRKDEPRPVSKEERESLVESMPKTKNGYLKIKKVL